MKKIILIFFLLSFAFNISAHDKILEPGEELTYKVYYHFIKLGEVTLKITNKIKDGDFIVYSAIANIKSYDGIPFVSINYKFETKMNHKDNDLYSQYFSSTEFNKKSPAEKYNSISITDYYFQHDDNLIRITKQTDMNITRDDTVTFTSMPKFQDGLSIFYNARLNSLKQKPYRIPVFMNEQESSVNYSFNMNEDVVSIDAFDYDISVIKIEGVALFKAIFGLTGEFKGWLSNDDYRVPVKAEFNVVIGKITMELSSFKKSSWQPPKFVN